MLKYLSPTSLRVFESDPEAFYLAYLSGRPRAPQTPAMAAGAAFDAFVKSELLSCLFGNTSPFSLFAFSLFESQVEKHNQDEAWTVGQIVLARYKELGAFNALLERLQASPVAPRFETGLYGEVFGVPLHGKPDIIYFTPEGSRVVHDFKVNGFYSTHTTSPKPGYFWLRPENKSHDRYEVGEYKGIPCCVAQKMPQVNEEWADQMMIYAWLTGERIGSEDMVVWIDQVVGPRDKLRVASFSNRACRIHQEALSARLVEAWEIINSDWLFRDLSREDSQRRCEILKTEDSEYVS